MIPFSRGRGFAFASLHVRVPRLGWKGAQGAAPSAREMDFLSWQVGSRVRGQRCPGEPERAGAHSQVLGVQFCALYQATRTFGVVLGQESYSADCLEVG